jgi:glutathione S-transferase
MSTALTELVFYTNPQSRGRIAHWMLEEVGQPYTTVWLDYGPQMKDPAYLGVNPMGKVPALRDGDVVVTEAAAICAYLADRFAQAGLAPDPASRGRAPYLRWLFFAAGPLEQATVAHALGWQVPDGRNGMVGFGSRDQTLATLEGALSDQPFLCGDRFTAADVYVGSSLGWGLMFGTIDRRPAFEAYVARCQARPAAQRVNQINQARIDATKA